MIPRKLIQLIFTVSLVILNSSDLLLAELPNLINFQASLSDSQGNPISGPRSIMFSLYISETGSDGSDLAWQEPHPNVQVTDGLYFVQLGSITSFPNNLFAESELWLGVKVALDLEQSPRIRIISVPYSLYSKRSESADVALTVKADTIGADQITNDSILSADIKDGTITNADLSAGSFPGIASVGILDSLNVTGVVAIGGVTVIDSVGKWVGDPTGLQGPEGLQGIQGPVGTDGAPGAAGDPGAAGSDGRDGLNCWDLNGNGIADPSEDVNADTVFDARDCLGSQGPDGPQGSDGAIGPSGPPGPPGAAGVDGQGGLNCWDLNGNGTADPSEDVNGDTVFDALDCQGPEGEPGMTGTEGPAGPQGTQGLTGPQGPAGSNGSQGLQGPAGPVAGVNKQIVYNDNGNAGGADAHFDNVTGNFGIGANTPGQKLEVNGNIYVNDTSGTGYIMTNRGASTNSNGLQLLTAGANSWSIGSIADATDNLHIIDDTNAMTRLFIDQSLGNVGIGTTEPRAKFHVAGDLIAKGPIFDVRGYGGATADAGARIQAAIDDSNVPEGATISVTGLTGDQTISNKIIINKAVTILFGAATFTYTGTDDAIFEITKSAVMLAGAGRGRNANTNLASPDLGLTIFYLPPANSARHIIANDTHLLQLRDFTLKGPGRDLTAGGGIKLSRTNNGNVNGLFFKNLLITDVAETGIELATPEGADSEKKRSHPIMSIFQNIRIVRAGRHGIYINGGTSVNLNTVYSGSILQSAFRLEGLSYSTLQNTAAEAAGIGYDIISSFNITLLSPGAEEQTDRSTDFKGHAFHIKGGNHIDLISPYSRAVAGAESFHFWLEDANNVIITNPRIKQANAPTPPPPDDIFVDANSKNVELVVDLESTKIRDEGENTLIRSGQKFSSLEFTSDIDRYYSVTPASFTVTNSGSTPGFEDVLIDMEAIKVMSVTTLAQVNVIAPVNLPHGAKIVKFSANVLDNLNEDINVSLNQVSLTGTTSPITTLTSSSATPTPILLSSAPLTTTIDNMNNHYAIRVSWTPVSGSPDIEFYSCVIKYIISKPLP